MKRLFVLFAFLLVSCAVFAQDEKPQSEGTLLIVPRLDLEPAWNSDGEWSFDLGTTSLYTLFEGNITRNLSFSFSNHWFTYCSSWDDATDLYRHTWRSDVSNWCDWANLTYKIGNFFISAGKDYVRIANFEIEDYDYDAHWQMNSALWNNFQVYQWGGRIGWQSEDEDLTISFQATTDPGMYKPFEYTDPATYCYTLNAFYEGETLQLMGSASHSGSWGWLGALGAKVALSDELSLGTDVNFCHSLVSGSLRFDAAMSDKLELGGKIGYERGSLVDGGHLFGGVSCNWYPLNGSHDLRVHFLAAPSLSKYYSGYKSTDLFFSAGATYFFEFNLF
ncbi:MAG: hypothetical protein K6G79_05695 [Bacteroidales bacterium]|nr:hypothetical protein [Bacteroidales bacterium]